MLAFTLAAIAAAIFYFNFWNSDSEVNKEQYYQYAMANTVPQIDINRGVNNQTDEATAKAAIAYENGNFSEAIEHYKSSSAPLNTNLFYLAYSLMREKKHAEAKTYFEEFIIKSKSTDPLLAEAKVFQVINLLIIGEVDQAKAKFESMNLGTWEKKELTPYFE